MTEALANALAKAHSPDATPEERELMLAVEDLLGIIHIVQGMLNSKSTETSSRALGI